MRLISIVMGAPSIKAREDASAALLNYGYNFFETVRVKAARELILKPRVYKSAGEFAELGVPFDVYATVGRGQGASLKTGTHLTGEPLIAPLFAGKPVGEFTVTDATGELIARAPLVPFAAVPLGSLWTRMLDSIALWFH
jgi:D-alanyl-D-alanine carboxypeptidase (penicillin-binding protein 5/6)